MDDSAEAGVGWQRVRCQMAHRPQAREKWKVWAWARGRGAAKAPPFLGGGEGGKLLPPGAVRPATASTATLTRVQLQRFVRAMHAGAERGAMLLNIMVPRILFQLYRQAAAL
jgi:hypothetical protein